MNIKNFINFNQLCPICQEPLTLYMQWMGSVCFKATLVEPDIYRFDPFKCTRIYNGRGDYDLNERKTCEDSDYVLMDVNKERTTISFETAWAATESQRHDIYLFYLCNEIGFRNKGDNDYEINLYHGCYYRSTPPMKLKKSDNDMHSNFLLLKDDCASLINKDEAFSFKFSDNSLEKVYMLNLDYEAQKTILWHYVASHEEKNKNKDNFEPKLFEKEMPLLNVRPKFDSENREKLISRFDSWILMS